MLKFKHRHRVVRTIQELRGHGGAGAVSASLAVTDEVSGVSSVVEKASSPATGAGLVTVYEKVSVTLPPRPSLAVTTTV